MCPTIIMQMCACHCRKQQVQGQCEEQVCSSYIIQTGCKLQFKGIHESSWNLYLFCDKILISNSTRKTTEGSRLRAQLQVLYVCRHDGTSAIASVNMTPVEFLNMTHHLIQKWPDIFQLHINTRNMPAHLLQLAIVMSSQCHYSYWLCCMTAPETYTYFETRIIEIRHF